jgi:LmbE family N-acetylglucosaminyl deacetylase
MSNRVIPIEECNAIECDDYQFNMQGRCTTENCPLKKREKKKVLVFACHPDDEVLGCGGAIQKHIEQGDSVDVCVITEASIPEWDLEYKINKIEEQKKVDKLLGISNRYFFNYITLELNTVDRGRFNWHFYKIIEQVRPDIIYTHYNHELNEEHTLVSQGTIVGSRIPNKATIFMYETPSGRFSLTPFKPNYYVSLTHDMYVKKLDAFRIYESEVKEEPHPQSVLGVANLMRYRGQEVGFDNAEAFIQVRRLWQ